MLRGLYLVVLAGAALAAAWWTWGRGEAVTTVVVSRGNAAEVVYATGTVEPLHWAKVVPLQRRRLVEMCDCEGKPVTAGQVLARQEDAEERAGLAELEARRALLEKESQRLTSLLERNAASVIAVDAANTALKESAARITVVKERLDALVLRAPMAGFVLRQDFHLGEIVGQGDVVFWVGQKSPLRIVSEVNEEDVPRVRPGQTALLRNEGFGGRPLVATVSDITPKGDPVAKTFRVYLGLPEDTPLLIGMSVEANVVVREQPNALLVPAEAIAAGAAFRVEGGRVRRVPVTTGIRGTRMIEVTGGLSEGDRIVSPVGDLRDGDRVRIETTAR